MEITFEDIQLTKTDEADHQVLLLPEKPPRTPIPKQRAALLHFWILSQHSILWLLHTDFRHCAFLHPD